MVNRELLAPCGLYCGACGAYIATRDDNDRLRAGMAKVFGCAPEEIDCQGCQSEVRYAHCQTCAIRACAGEKGFEGCYQCGDFPCEHIEALGARFPHTVAHQVIMRTIPQWRELGTEAWVATEEARYTCPSCGQGLMRGGTRCPGCGGEVRPD